MKKIYLLLLMLIAGIGSTWAQQPTASDAPSNGKWATNTTWYFIQFANSDAYHTAGYMATEGDNYINSDGQLLLNGSTKPTTTAGLWCFVGDDTNGYTIYNRKSGTSLVFSETTAGVGKMLAAGTDGYTQAFDYAASTSTKITNAAVYKLHGTDNTYLNNSDGSPKCHIGVWASDDAVADNGSAMVITAVSDDELVAMGVQPKVTTDETNPVYFYLKAKRDGNYANYTGDATAINQVTAANRTNNSLWYVTAVTGGGYLLHNKGTQKIYSGLNSFTESGTTMYIAENPFNAGYVCVSTNADNTTSGSCWDSEGSGTKIGPWDPASGDADGTSWTIVYSESGDATKDVLGAAIESASQSIGTDPGFYTQASIDAAKAVYDGTDTSKSYAEATTTLQNSMILPTTGKFYRITSAYSAFETQQSVTKSIYVDGTTLKWKSTDGTDLTQYWKIYKNSSDVYVFYNYSTNQYINTITTMGDEAASSTGFTWFEGGQCNIAIAGGNMHANGHSSGAGTSGTIISYGSGANGASAWYIQEVGDPELESAKAALQAKVDEYDTSNTYMYGINPGQYSITGITSEALSNALSDAQTVLDGGSTVAQDYKDALTTLNTKLEGATKSLNYLTVGKYYRIQSTTRETYTGLNMNNSNHTGDSKMWNYTLDETDPRQIWQLEQDGDNYYLVNVCSGTYPQYVNGGGTSTTYVGAKNESYKFTWSKNSEVSTTAYPTWNIFFGGRQVNIESAGYVNYWTGENAHHYLWKVDKTDAEILALVKAWATAQNYTANAGTEKKYTITEGATLISPSEYAAALVPDAIDAVNAYADAETPTLAQAQALYNNYQIVADYVSASNSYGDPLSCNYTATEGWNTVIMPVNFAKPSTWTLYTCAAVDGKVLTLTEASSGTKGIPYIVKSTAAGTFQIIGYSNGATTENQTSGLLTGVITSATTSDGYVLSSDAKSMEKVSSETNVAQYYCYIAANAALTENNYYFDTNDVPPTQITETRDTPADKYGTICLPYDFTAEGAVVMSFTGRSDKGLVFEPVSETTFSAGVPYLYRATAATQTFTTTGATWADATPVNNFTGSYTEVDLSKTTSNTTENFFLYTPESMFYPAGEYVHMSAYKCYFPTLPSVGGARTTVNSVVFSIMGETTGIYGIDTTADLNKNGKFIQNGRMVIVNNGKKFNAAGQNIK